MEWETTGRNVRPSVSNENPAWQKTKRDVQLFEEFLRKEKNYLRQVNTIAQTKLNKYLAGFIRSDRRKDGRDNNPSSLRCLVSSLERHLKKHDYPVSIINDKQFEFFRKSLQSKQKEFKKAGRGNKSKAALPLTDEKIYLLYENNMLGVSSAESLLNTVWLNNTIHFGMQSCQKHFLRTQTVTNIYLFFFFLNSFIDHHTS